MQVFSLIPIAIYTLLVLITFLFYLAQGFLIQIQLVKILYGVGLLGALIHIPDLIQYLYGRATKRIWTYIQSLIDIILLGLIIAYAPTGQNIALFFMLLYVFYLGVRLNPKISSAGAFVLFCISAVVMVVKSEVTSFPLLLNLLVMGASLSIMVAISGLVSGIFAEQKIENAHLEAINESVFASVPVGLLVTNDDGDSLSANQKALGLFKKINANYQEESVYSVLPELRSFGLSDEPFLDIIRKAGERFIFLRLRSQPLKIAGFEGELRLFVIEDRTVLERAEQAKRQSEKMAAVGTLAAGIAHEIRNPLTGMSGALQLLEPDLNSEEQLKLTKIVYREIDRLNNLITEFLEFSKPDAEPPTDRVNIAAVLKETLNMVAQDTRFPFLKSQTWGPFKDVWVLGFSDKLKQVFLNIFVNAAQSMEKSLDQSLTVTLEPEEGWVLISIQDRGVGMSESTKNKIFEPFHTTKPKGTGLGMAITLKIIQAHRGQIFVESREGVGTQIDLRFPLAPTLG